MKHIIIILLLFIGPFTFSQTFILDDAPNLWGGTNQTSSIGFDLNGNKIIKGKNYFNSLGKETQNLSWDVLTDKIWGSQMLYDRHGRPVLHTLSAPVSGGLVYSDNFILDSGANTYTTSDFDLGGTIDNPSIVSGSSELGAYYTTSNTTNPYQDITSYPFERIVYSKLIPGNGRKILGGNKISGEWKQSYTFSMPMGEHVPAGECTSPYFPIDGSTTRVTKTVSRDVHGEDIIILTDSDGNTLAAARSGLIGNPHCEATDLLIGPQGYVDIHIAKSVTKFSISDLDISIVGGSLKVYNLITENLEGTITADGDMNVTSGFYRIAVSDPFAYALALKDPQTPATPITVNHIIDYYDYSFNLYDKAGRLTSSTQPLNENLESTFSYNSLGQLLETSSPDEGTSKFRYRTDGQIRFSQNALQASKSGWFSYTHYDNLGRPIESGVYDGPISFENANVDAADGLDDQYCSEVHHTVYDIPDPDLAAIFTTKDCSLVGHHYYQSFVAGNVVKTYTTSPETSTTWYSYDVQGRLTWVVQKVEGLLCYKTIDYTYDPGTGQVLKVDYQRHNNDDRFVHKYAYNAAGQLISVHTSRDGINFEEQATYQYAESGELTRTVLAEDLQGIDYLYNLNGQLKAINHPSLLPTHDPGGDGGIGSNVAADVFGFAIDYYNGDYSRTGTPTPIAQQNTHGTDQFNGNIKGVRFNTEGFATGGGIFQSYMYQYNRNNWLEAATYGSGSIGGSGGNYQVNFTPNSNDDYEVSNLDYDANGNIKSLKRNGFTDSGGNNAMDDFEYSYDGNRLRTVADTGDNTVPNRYDDLRDQSANGADNYIYNALGQLVSDAQGQKTYEYNASGLVNRIRTFGAGGQPQQIFLQDFSTATNIEANQWTTSLGASATIHYAYYIPDGGSSSCTTLDNSYGQSIKLQLTNNQYAHRELEVAANIPHTLNLDVIVDQWSTGQQPAGYVIEIYNVSGLGPTPIASVTYNSALAYIDDPDLSGAACDKYYENSESLTFTPSGGKIKLQIKKISTAGNEPIYLDNIALTVETVPLMDIAYNDRGQRVQKKVYSPTNGNTYLTYYLRDVAGNTLAVYNVTNTLTQTEKDATLDELTIYGASRLGIYKMNPGFSEQEEGTPPEGFYYYQLTDHLGNVRAVIGKAANGTPYVIAKTDYYPFGMPMPERNVEGDYRYKFQGQEKDAETGMEAFELRLWDSRIGRWMTTDPGNQFFSSYLGLGNNPVNGVEANGADWWQLTKDGSLVLIKETNDRFNVFFDSEGVEITRTNAPMQYLDEIDGLTGNNHQFIKLRLGQINLIALAIYNDDKIYNTMMRRAKQTHWNNTKVLDDIREAGNLPAKRAASGILDAVLQGISIAATKKPNVGLNYFQQASLYYKAKDLYGAAFDQNDMIDLQMRVGEDLFAAQQNFMQRFTTEWFWISQNIFNNKKTPIYREGRKF